MKGYSTRDVARLLTLSEAQVRGFVQAGFLSPERGPRREMRFSFQDLVFLRTASGLAAAGVAPRRIRAALSRLREQMPDGRPLTAVRIAVEGSRIVVEEGARRWQPESGQILFDFGVADLARKVAPMVRRAFREAQEDGLEFSADDWFEWACELEPGSPAQAREAYAHALALDPAHADAHVNLGRLLHESGDAAAAEPHYRGALAARPGDATAAFNLGVALEDLGRDADALEAYERAVSIDPGNADAHFNAAALAEKLG
ncbi:MAG TPA: tetratricopeptide repeat protein, partial [Thermoanaerobaculia bacterium]|nr:tetratricopeptide repeat protein [Thermoanaerobaculia bacterium]